MPQEIKNADELAAKIKTNVTAQIEAIQKKFEDDLNANGAVTAETKSALADLAAKLKTSTETGEGLAIEIQELTQKLADNLNVTAPVVKTMSQELDENKDDLALLAKGHTSVPIVIKADTVRSSVTDNENALTLGGLGQLATAKLTAYDIFNKIPVSDANTNGVIRYYDWDAATTVRAANAIAENGTFPESTAKWVGQTLTIEKLGDTLPVSEEFFEDSDMFAAELNMFLETNVKIKRNTDLVNGDGVTPNIKGLVATVGAFTAAASGITDASIYDLIVKVAESITTSGGAKYTPNFALMNIADINKMKLKKDANNNYIIPPFVSRDGSSVAGILVLEENAVAADTFVLGDSRYARIYERKGIEMSRGHVNAQFAEDMETLKVRTRLAFLIRNADLGGFKKVTGIAADLVTLAS